MTTELMKNSQQLSNIETKHQPLIPSHIVAVNVKAHEGVVTLIWYCTTIGTVGSQSWLWPLTTAVSSVQVQGGVRPHFDLTFADKLWTRSQVHYKTTFRCKSANCSQDLKAWLLKIQRNFICWQQQCGKLCLNWIVVVAFIILEIL